MRDARFEIVRAAAGKQPWHARFIAPNGRIVWTTEQYARRRAAENAVETICGYYIQRSPHAAHPEIYWKGNGERPTEVRYIDDRATP